MEVLFILSLVLAAVSLVLVIVLLAKQGVLNREVIRNIDEIQEQMRDAGSQTDQKLENMRSQMHSSAVQTEQKLENMRVAMSDSIGRMQQSNTEQLNIIRRTVDEKLQDTLDKKLNESFKMVSERLEQVYRGLGEMQTLATGVGDLKKVLSNVKTRGVLGEIQLGAILEQILSPEQYERNVETRKGSRAIVEYAIKLPGDDGSPVWLPIDAKFPSDAYTQLLDAYDAADAAAVDAAQKQLKQRIRAFARDIATKYIEPPATTEFGIMFLPAEGLYAEVVRSGMIEELQNEYRICIAGPTTMGALLNSIQMGFKTLAIQKRSAEVWKVLSAVKGEFDTFASVLEKTQLKLNQANDELDKLVGTRTRMIQSKLKGLQSMPTEQAASYLEGHDEQVF